ncbi:3-oxoadipate enol-lactonase [Actinoplanes philippinensis]|uniref:3-oxoadipate enol-lactonase / 4-carboxymuconolactone decarboxylase n=1 Tax=Actinoplanes philippinensis TaxID=35752 RepID=A0A1I1ZCB7_9ACTN|nr:4-carboxymuconolactone decarboxylase [Actinoplanes philippinensis]GIE75556.1 3-oxoadipate enol-lactonase [Actinoplanes philippinensis]SFE29474.1 3-oxoadipate enol-lactonase / 4-carboxymuconolactone decarboxylase [Actinoplanes philippinensis]
MLTATTFTDAPGRPLLLLGPSVGTSAATLWAACADRLYGRYHVVGWDLPGHGASAPATGPFTIADLAREVLALAGRIRPGEAFHYAGDSIGGAVGLQLLLDAPDRVAAAALLCTGAKIGEPAMWHDRAALVRAEGVESVVAGARERWFAPGAPPPAAESLVAALRATDAESYARACEALAEFDVRDRLPEIAAPVLAVAGGHDRPTPPDSLRAIADGVLHGRLVVLDGVAHLAPAESPEVVAFLLDQHFDEQRSAGIAVRREVLGPAHVDRATAGTTAFTRDFQDMITRYAWAEIWTRPGLARRDRSLITLTALIALGHHEELAMHVRAARTNGLSDDEIKELILQTAVYCGVPAANTAFRIAQKVLDTP